MNGEDDYLILAKVITRVLSKNMIIEKINLEGCDIFYNPNYTPPPVENFLLNVTAAILRALTSGISCNILNGGSLKEINILRNHLSAICQSGDVCNNDFTSDKHDCENPLSCARYLFIKLISTALSGERKVSLCGIYSSLEECTYNNINLKCKEIDTTTIHMVCQELQRNSLVQKLDLSYNAEECFYSLIPVISQHPSLRKLKLSFACGLQPHMQPSTKENFLYRLQIAKIASVNFCCMVALFVREFNFLDAAALRTIVEYVFGIHAAAKYMKYI